MVLLTVTDAANAAVAEYCRLNKNSAEDRSEDAERKLEGLSKIETGNAIDHNDLIEVSAFLVKQGRRTDSNAVVKEWRLDTLLKGANVYQAPPPPKPEPTSEYKALMSRLRKEEENRQYERMVHPPPPTETFNQRFPHAGPSFGPTADTEVDEVTYADVNRQMALIINVLVSIIACSVAIWIAARRWEVPQRLGLSMSGSGLVAAAEVTIYMGYIRRIKEAKGKEVKMVESKEIVETWVLDGVSGKDAGGEGIRFRKGKHR
ncbi:hypothetical protein LTR37_018233 [Vermiconidia calcicola]|uniref:Uncharacterized protein n=1 Tax=Vermiconidia calcicola TaxID=1690605 RepID=A0ACC3MJA1_9PEZI|nr:hypothetical protein LTR37_018233 [Vermiconidia calcicola]